MIVRDRCNRLINEPLCFVIDLVVFVHLTTMLYVYVYSRVLSKRKSVFLCLCPSVWRFVSLFVCLSVFPFVCLYVCIIQHNIQYQCSALSKSTCVSVCLPGSPLVFLVIFQSLQRMFLSLLFHSPP